MKRPNQNSRRMEARREEAITRNAKWAKLSPKQQLASLDKRGLTATKQRAKIQRRIEHEEQKKAEAAEAKKAKQHQKKGKKRTER